MISNIDVNNLVCLKQYATTCSLSLVAPQFLGRSMINRDRSYCWPLCHGFLHSSRPLWALIHINRSKPFHTHTFAFHARPRTNRRQGELSYASEMSLPDTWGFASTVQLLVRTTDCAIRAHVQVSVSNSLLGRPPNRRRRPPPC